MADVIPPQKSETSFEFFIDTQKNEKQHGKQKQWTLQSKFDLLFDRWFPAILVERFVLYQLAFRIFGCTTHEEATKAKLTLKPLKPVNEEHQPIVLISDILLSKSGLRIFMLYPSLRNVPAGAYEFILEMLDENNNSIDSQTHSMQLKSKSKGKEILRQLQPQHYPEWIHKLQCERLILGKRKAEEEPPKKARKTKQCKSNTTKKEQVEELSCDQFFVPPTEQYSLRSSQDVPISTDSVLFDNNIFTKTYDLEPVPTEYNYTEFPSIEEHLCWKDLPEDCNPNDFDPTMIPNDLTPEELQIFLSQAVM
mmetsp:Transcript_393/g.536  ORF Transcript_393/g.536 Transcript_393/m.536 type:complete len:308 (+) Transcript_393:67-990(+)